jgi:hypothetical protein
MHRHVSRNTIRIDCCARGRNRTLRNLQITPGEAAYGRVNVPHTARQTTGCRKIPLYQDSTLLLALCADEHVAPLYLSRGPWRADLYDRLGAVHIVEEGAGRHDSCVCFANDLSAWGEG